MRAWEGLSQSGVREDILAVIPRYGHLTATGPRRPHRRPHRPRPFPLPPAAFHGPRPSPEHVARQSARPSRREHEHGQQHSRPPQRRARTGRHTRLQSHPPARAASSSPLPLLPGARPLLPPPPRLARHYPAVRAPLSSSECELLATWPAAKELRLPFKILDERREVTVRSVEGVMMLDLSPALVDAEISKVWQHPSSIGCVIAGLLCPPFCPTQLLLLCLVQEPLPEGDRHTYRTGNGPRGGGRFSNSPMGTMSNGSTESM
ncbi:hypothetical protein CALVIDRAFT_405073 [Calocera viscosa TUFC12733]|uniref:Uncharacterized protein n=1 Tax=Calocera viscosa (strain TUFC12733) TaxID=1330018 RepID=A0A167PWZ7_CALVF|nr:hypothetical protein CALVIDRAFT_405073 [Calocera viscosa TUFC12733]